MPHFSDEKTNILINGTSFAVDVLGTVLVSVRFAVAASGGSLGIGFTTLFGFSTAALGEGPGS